jgi:hypothetical protein
VKTKRGAEKAPRAVFDRASYQLPLERAGFVFAKQSLQ